MHDSRYVDAFPDARFRAGGCDSAAAAGINGNEIVFSRAGDLWRVGKAGGAAVRLTTGQGMETYPVFSPDGETVAFSGEYDGTFDVYTVPVAGGVPKRITDYPGIDEPAAWTNDGKHIVFRSGRSAVSRYRQRFRIPAEGGAEERLPFKMALAGSLSADGANPRNATAFLRLGGGESAKGGTGLRRDHR